MSTAFTDLALVTGLVPFGDADWVVHLLTEQHGRIGAFAKSARRSKRKFTGLQPLLLANVQLRPRRNGLMALDKIEPMRHPMSAVADLVVLGRAAYLTELTTRMIPEDMAEPEAFFRLVQALDALAEDVINDVRRDGRIQAEILRSYELKLLDASGELLDLTALSPCAAFDAREGILLREPSSKSISFSEEARVLALQLLQTEFTLLQPQAISLLREVGRLFAVYLRQANLPRLKSLYYLKDLERNRVL